MEIIVSIVVILFVFLGLYILWLYNQLIHLQINKDNTLVDIAPTLDLLFSKLNAEKYKKQIKKREQAKTSQEKIAAFNTLHDHLEDIYKKDTTQIFITQTTTERRYYNHLTKKLNALLLIFPTNIVGNILGYEKELSFLLRAQEKKGEHAGVKR